MDAELVCLAEKPVRTGAGNQVDDRTRDVSVFRFEGGVVDLELFDAADWRRKPDRPEGQIVRGDAVDDVADSLFAIARGVEGKCTRPANGRRRKPRLRRRH
jgi:hypothetical protein